MKKDNKKFEICIVVICWTLLVFSLFGHVIWKLVFG
nr:MAG TPA: hypothetical protein [Caudoviricetes sp.]